MPDLTPELAVEVRWNLLKTGALVAGLILLGVGLLVVVIDPSAGPRATAIGGWVLVALALPMALLAGLSYTLAFPMGCWPAFLKPSRLPAVFGVEAETVSNPSLRRLMRRFGYWRAFGRGMAVGLVFVVPWLGLTTIARGWDFPDGLTGPAALICVFAGGIAVRSWAVRRAVEERATMKKPLDRDDWE